MGWRYRSTIRLLPGLRVNLSKSGASLSVGRRGATVNVGRPGIRGTVGVPGSGLSYSESAPWHRRGHPLGPVEPPAPQRHGLLLGILVLLAIAVLLFATR